MTKLTGEEKQLVFDALMTMLNVEAISVEAGYYLPDEFRKLCISVSALCKVAGITDVVTEWRKKNPSRRFIY